MATSDTDSIVTINGAKYDSVTGLPIAPKKVGSATTRQKPATSIHQTTQKSRTLNRQVIKKPLHQSTIVKPKPGHAMDIAKHNGVTRFAPHPNSKPSGEKVASIDIAPRPHPRVAQVLARQNSARPTTAASLSAQEIKRAAITKAMAQPSGAGTRSKKPASGRPRAWTIVGAIVILLLLGGYVLYTNLPSISVAVASAEAGIQASYPTYIPDGYGTSGPVTYSDGQIVIHFSATTGSSSFAITQSKSSWDSSAVLSNIVNQKVGDNYLTTEQAGLTIYTYNDSAAWVNSGILYTINGNAPLSSDQIGQIAASM